MGSDDLYAIADQCRRIRELRSGAGDAFFINCRTDLFLKADASTHDQQLTDAAIERGLAYADAGADGYFIPALADLKLVERICGAVPIPVNAMQLPGGPSRTEWASAGVARISHGPFPFRRLMEQLTTNASEAMA